VGAAGPADAAAREREEALQRREAEAAAGKQAVGVTITSPDPNVYRAAANAGCDYAWIETQHSPLTFGDAAQMIYARRGASAAPLETDTRAIGVIVPTVDTVEKAEAAVRWSRYPMGRRSQGLGQYGALWGNDDPQAANGHMFVSGLLSGLRTRRRFDRRPASTPSSPPAPISAIFPQRGSDSRNRKLWGTKIHDVTLTHRLALEGPLARKDRSERPRLTCCEGGTEISLIPMGARVNLGVTSGGRGQQGREGVAPVEGQEK